MMGWHGWAQYFEGQRDRPMPNVDGAGRGLSPQVACALAESLARFQLGEAGGGSIARRIDGIRLEGIDDDYRRALKRFVAEEHRHGAILASLVKALSGELLAKTWTDGLFTFGRRRMGLRLKVMVLLSAEVIGLAFYGAIAQAVGPGPVRVALEQICRDEAAHLHFHCDFFRSQTRGFITRWLFRAGLWTVGLAACVTVLVDHARQLRALGLRPATVGRSMVQLLARADAALEPSVVGSTPALPRY